MDWDKIVKIGMYKAITLAENSFVFPTQADCMAQRWRVRNHEGVLARLFLYRFLECDR